MVDGAFCCNKCYKVYTLPHSPDSLPAKIRCSSCNSVQKPRSEYRNAVKNARAQADPAVKSAIRRELVARYLVNLATGKYNSPSPRPRTAALPLARRGSSFNLLLSHILRKQA